MIKHTCPKLYEKWRPLHRIPVVRVAGLQLEAEIWSLNTRTVRCESDNAPSNAPISVPCFSFIARIISNSLSRSRSLSRPRYPNESARLVGPVEIDDFGVSIPTPTWNGECWTLHQPVISIWWSSSSPATTSIAAVRAGTSIIIKRFTSSSWCSWMTTLTSNKSDRIPDYTQKHCVERRND